MSHTQPEGTVRVWDITLTLQRQFSETVDYILFETKTERVREVPTSFSPGRPYKKVFDPALDLSIQDKLTISIHNLPIPITITLNDVKTGAKHDEQGRKVYSQSFEDVLVLVGVSDLSSHDSVPHQSSHESSSLSNIAQVSPFRILVIGNVGVGKSNLIQKAFGVRDVQVSHSSRGPADIEREFIAEQNGSFILHDSLGLEAGEDANIVFIKQFIERRRKMEHIKDRLHAVWVCLAIPYAKARFLELGIINFLKARETILGDIPLVVVLTKLDLLEKQLLLKYVRVRPVNSLQEAIEGVEPERKRFLHEYCIQPLREEVGDVPPNVAVSVAEPQGLNLESTVLDLIDFTTRQIEDHVKRASTRGLSSLQTKWVCAHLEHLHIRETSAQAKSFRGQLRRNTRSDTISFGGRNHKGTGECCLTPPQSDAFNVAFLHAGLFKSFEYGDHMVVVKVHSDQKEVADPEIGLTGLR